MPEEATDPVIAWEDPPRQVKRTSDWPSIAGALKANPGRWAAVSTHDSHNKALSARNTLARHGIPDSKSRTVDGSVVVYARYVPEVAS